MKEIFNQSSRFQIYAKQNKNKKNKLKPKFKNRKLARFQLP